MSADFKSNEPVSIGEGFAFFRGHCLMFSNSPCMGLAESRRWGGVCGFAEFHWNKTALKDTQP